MPVLPRRRVLTAALAVAATGAACRNGGTSGAPRHPASPSPNAPPDPQLADLTAERTLLAAYEATLQQHTTLAARLSPLRDDHRDHVAALERALGLPHPQQRATSTPSGSVTPSASAAPRGSASPLGRLAVPQPSTSSRGPSSSSSTTGPGGSGPNSAGPSGTATPPGAGGTGVPAPTVPATPEAALAALRDAERTAAAARTASALATPLHRMDRAALLASIAACEASHEAVLQ